MHVLADRYRLVTPIGKGGMAAVWRADDLVLDRTVAVKLLSPGLTTDAVPGDLIRREARAAAKLCHPHIAAVYDYGEEAVGDAIQPYIVMEYVPGSTVAQRIARDGPMEWPDAAALGAEVASALAAAHGIGLVHRDVKPGNVMLTSAGAKVVDFGVCAAAGDRPTDAAGRIWGTPAYLPPEQLHQGEALPAGDVYGLGLLLYECLTGRPPWRLTGVDEVLAQRRRIPVPELPEAPSLPADVTRLYHRCLAAAPQHRPSAEQAATVLALAAEGRQVLRRGVPAIAAQAHGMAATVAHRRPALSRKMAVTVAAPVLVAAGLLAVQLPGSGSPRDVAEADMPAQDRTAAVPSCAAEYTGRRDGAGSFTARLRMTNTGERTMRHWTLRFMVPDGQQVAETSGGTWTQHRGTVRIKAAQPVAPGGTVTMSLSGTVDAHSDEVPDGFAVDGVACARAVTRVRASTTPHAVRPARATHTGSSPDGPRRRATRSTTSPPSATDPTAPVSPTSRAPEPDQSSGFPSPEPRPTRSAGAPTVSPSTGATVPDDPPATRPEPSTSAPAHEPDSAPSTGPPRPATESPSPR
ncbi:serine/threonine-protein kinase [Nucisporomicrobium flavum]|uniref:serine/threonine-protein kinase n=1 Tax=Nucisporomicrobium flavum TaxID=2785915 RepID=UPI0018F46D77|nr:serine/threonine-protein kinase [Nucisporomicrobium flavum]